MSKCRKKTPSLTLTTNHDFLQWRTGQDCHWAWSFIHNKWWLVHFCATGKKVRSTEHTTSRLDTSTWVAPPLMGSVFKLALLNSNCAPVSVKMHWTDDCLVRGVETAARMADKGAGAGSSRHMDLTHRLIFWARWMKTFRQNSIIGNSALFLGKQQTTYSVTYRFFFKKFPKKSVSKII